MTLLQTEGLVKYYRAGGSLFRGSSKVHAVDGVAISIKGGETLGLVGESGCGKSTLGRLLARLEDPDRGKIIFDGREITNCTGEEQRLLRSRIQFIFQDSYSSLDRLGESSRNPWPILLWATGKSGKRWQKSSWR
jgi:ABC-type oligopeptide transport system ATPase subunit